MSFDNVILLLEMIKRDDNEVPDKAQLAFEMLFVESDTIYNLTANERLELFKHTFKEKFNFDLDRQNEATDEIVELADMPIPIYDFVEDAERIYASFLMDYNIDLIEQQGKLTWGRFNALLHNLSDETPFGKATYYRTVEVPKKDRHNGDEIKNIRAMKKKYQLKAAIPIIEAKQAREHERLLKQRKDRLKKKR